jgi:hypothetical protein
MWRTVLYAGIADVVVGIGALAIRLWVESTYKKRHHGAEFPRVWDRTLTATFWVLFLPVGLVLLSLWWISNRLDGRHTASSTGKSRRATQPRSTRPSTVPQSDVLRSLCGQGARGTDVGARVAEVFRNAKAPWETVALGAIAFGECASILARVHSSQEARVALARVGNMMTGVPGTRGASALRSAPESLSDAECVRLCAETARKWVDQSLVMLEAAQKMA